MNCTERHKRVWLVGDALKCFHSEPLMSGFIQFVLVSITSSKTTGRYKMLCLFLALLAVVLKASWQCLRLIFFKCRVLSVLGTTTVNPPNLLH